MKTRPPESFEQMCLEFGFIAVMNVGRRGWRAGTDEGLHGGGARQSLGSSPGGDSACHRGSSVTPCVVQTLLGAREVTSLILLCVEAGPCTTSLSSVMPLL